MQDEVSPANRENGNATDESCGERGRCPEGLAVDVEREKKSDCWNSCFCLCPSFVTELGGATNETEMKRKNRGKEKSNTSEEPRREEAERL